MSCSFMFGCMQYVCACAYCMCVSVNTSGRVFHTYFLKLKSWTLRFSKTDSLYSLCGHLFQCFMWTELNSQEMITTERHLKLVSAVNCHAMTSHNISSTQLHGCNKRSEKPIFTFNLSFTSNDLFVSTMTLMVTWAEQARKLLSIFCLFQHFSSKFIHLLIPSHQPALPYQMVASNQKKSCEPDNLFSVSQGSVIHTM